LFADRTEERRTRIDDGLKQSELLVAAVHHVEPTGFEHPVHRFLFAAFPVRDDGFHRSLFEHFEVQVQPGRLLACEVPQRPDHLRQRRQEAAVDSGQVGQQFGFTIVPQWPEPRGEIVQHLLEEIRVEDAGRFAERSQRSLRTAESFLHVLQATCLLNASQGGQHGVEKVKQDQRCVLIEEQRPVASLVAFGADLVKFAEHSLEELEILQAQNALWVELLWFFWWS